MSRSRSGTSLSIAELERILEDRRAELQRLTHERSHLHKRLEEIEEEIRRLGGERPNGQLLGQRPHNEKSLAETIEGILHQANQPLRVREIVVKVQEAGYKTTSSNFRGIVNQSLIKEKRFVSASRGFYTLKK